MNDATYNEIAVGHAAAGDRDIYIQTRIEDGFVDGEEGAVGIWFPHEQAAFLAASLLAYIPEERWDEVVSKARDNREALALTFDQEGASEPIAPRQAGVGVD